MALSKSQQLSRRAFSSEYGSEIQNIVKRIARGQGSHLIAENVGVSVMTVAAVRANVTRGSYWPWLEGDRVSGFSGTAGF